MTKETQDLQAKINAQRVADKPVPPAPAGFGLAIAMMTDLICCLLVGLGLGIIIQRWASTSPIVVVIFTMLGGVAGLVSVVKQGIKRSKS